MSVEPESVLPMSTIDPVSVVQVSVTPVPSDVNEAMTVSGMRGRSRIVEPESVDHVLVVPLDPSSVRMTGTVDPVLSVLHVLVAPESVVVPVLVVQVLVSQLFVSVGGRITPILVAPVLFDAIVPVLVFPVLVVPVFVTQVLVVPVLVGVVAHVTVRTPVIARISEYWLSELIW